MAVRLSLSGAGNSERFAAAERVSIMFLIARLFAPWRHWYEGFFSARPAGNLVFDY
jgi:hypothetical protein